MKTNLWNHYIELEAENEQDVDWLNQFVEMLTNLHTLSNFFEFDIGSVSYEGKVELECVSENLRNEELTLQETKRWLNSVASVVHLRINPTGIFNKDFLIKSLKRDLKKLSS